jgi:hypothetical protein
MVSTRNLEATALHARPSRDPPVPVGEARQVLAHLQQVRRGLHRRCRRGHRLHRLAASRHALHRRKVVRRRHALTVVGSGLALRNLRRLMTITLPHRCHR